MLRFFYWNLFILLHGQNADKTEGTKKLEKARKSRFFQLLSQLCRFLRLLRRLFHPGQDQGEPGPYPLFAGHLDPTAMPDGDPLGNGQPQTGAAGFSG